MPIVPNFLDRQIFLTLNQGPAPALDLFGAIGFRTVCAAINLGVFEALSSGPQVLSDLSRKTGTAENSLRMLLDALEALGYVRSKGNKYVITAMSKKWMTKESPTNIAPGFNFWDTILAQVWPGLEDSIRSGHSATDFYNWLPHHPDTSQQFQEWMVGLANLTADEIVEKIKIPETPQRLVDIGGGHGSYTIALCRKYPKLTATIVDAADTVSIARANADAQGFGDRISTRSGDIFNDDWGAGYDIALLFNILHGCSPEMNARLLARVAACLSPRSTLAIVEQLPGKISSPTASAVNSLLALSYFHLLGGRIYSFEEISSWLTGAGFSRPRRVGLLKVPGNALILSTLGIR